jgi:hypothetical protein
MEGQPLGRAQTTYNDWTGTVALDRPDPNRDDIYDVAGVDREQWVIVGFDLGGAYDSTFGWVYVVEAAKMSELKGAAAKTRVPVARRSIQTDAHPDDIAFRLLSAFKGWGISVRLKLVVQQDVDLVVERDLDLEEPARGD